MKKQYKKYLNALLQYNKKEASYFVHELLQKNMPIIDLYELVIKKALYEIGILWERNKISVAAEHLASAITESIMNEVYLSIVQDNINSKKVVISCVENEYHQIGAKMTADVFEMLGWNAFFLGANTPTPELIKFAKTTKPDLIAISIAIYSHFPYLEKMIQEFRKNSFICPIIVGGQAFNHGGKEILNKYSNVIYISDLEKLKQYINLSK